MIGNKAVRDKFLNKSAKSSLVIGGLTGILGCLLMIYSLHVSDTIIIDFRCIPVILMSIYFSYTAAFTTAGIIALFRMAFYGFNPASFTAAIVILIIALVCTAFNRSKKSLKIKWIFSVFITILISSIGLFIALYDVSQTQHYFIAYIIGMVVSSILVYYLISATIRDNISYVQLKENAHKDFLTGLNNVRYFDDTINKFSNASMKSNESLSLLFIDIDYFKKVNDKYGHTSGDIVLKDIGRILIDISRNNDIVTRKGGEEFTVLLANCSLEQAKIVSERIRSSIESHDFINETNQVIKVTVSIGVASYPETTLDIDKLIEQADNALYTAKHTGRNRVCIASIDNNTMK